MIVKNESAIIERCLRAASGHFDSWVIVDTGSDDGTCERIETILAGVPGQLEHRPWVDFGHNRTELMDLAYEESADWLLLLDADIVLEVDGDLHDLLPKEGTVDAWLVDVVGASEEYAMPYIVSGHRHWHYVGATHEYIDTEDRVVRARLNGVRFRHHQDGGTRPEKFERDRRLLEGQLLAKGPDARTVFYLAQTCRDLGDIDSAIEHYGQRATMGGWDEEAFYARYQQGVLEMRRSWDAGVSTLLDAWSMRPTRAEPLYHLATGYRERGGWPTAYLFAARGSTIPVPDDILFVDVPLYRWGLRFERSVAAWYVGNHEEAVEITEALLNDPELPDLWCGFAKSNLAFYTSQVAPAPQPALPRVE
jgi:hypothetical protein